MESHSRQFLREKPMHRLIKISNGFHPNNYLLQNGECAIVLVPVRYFRIFNAYITELLFQALSSTYTCLNQ